MDRVELINKKKLTAFVGGGVGVGFGKGEGGSPLHALLQSQTPSVNRSLSKNKSLHLLKLYRFGKTKSISLSDTPNQLAKPFHTASHGVVGIKRPLPIQLGLFGDNGRG